MGSPSQASPGRGQRRGDRAMTMKKWLRKRLVRAALGCGEKRRGAAGGGGGVQWRMAKPTRRSPGFDRQ
jgi:hypothetical protein